MLHADHPVSAKRQQHRWCRSAVFQTRANGAAGCGFVQFRKWAQAENAMEAHNGKTRMPSSEVPLVVKFADAKRREQPLHAIGMGYKRGGPGFFADPKHLPDPAAEFAMFQVRRHGVICQRPFCFSHLSVTHVSGSGGTIRLNLSLRWFH